MHEPVQSMVEVLVALDAVTYASSEYLLQASCTFAQLAGNAADLTLEAAGAVASFLAAHVASLLQSAQARHTTDTASGAPIAGLHCKS